MKEVIEKVTVNFGGFYNSIHSDLIDTVIEQELEEEGAEDFDWSLIDYSLLYKKYTENLIHAINDRFELSLTFVALDSPREYNFRTDVIVVDMSIQDYNKLWLETDQDYIKDCIKEHTTRRDGFIPYYNSVEILAEPQFLAEFMLDYILEEEDFSDVFYEDNDYVYEEYGRCML